ncbi:hypothetical protein [Candidatus Palauibacter sp.]|uniref:hypothetical protein n=1 Tax=Candidatus Palauibacter sp. TaxID=3101350 RepID=UPI003AF2B6F5
MNIASAASEMIAVTRVMARNSHSAQRPMSRYPSTRLRRVAAAYRAPYSKKGYLRMSAKTITPTKANPASAPARVDCTRWETPTEVAAQMRPGPKLFQKLERVRAVGSLNGSSPAGP